MTINIYNTIFSAPKNLTDKYKDIAMFMQVLIIILRINSSK
jgi:hypothetical protein